MWKLADRDKERMNYQYTVLVACGFHTSGMDI